MGDQTIYFLFTDTGTYLSKAINYCTKQPLNHVSIGFDDTLSEVYSFGRKRPRNPFIGGFVKEDITSSFLRNSECAIYKYTMTQGAYQRVIADIKDIEGRKDAYKYNFLGLFGVLLRIKIDRPHAMFCSQFVATVLKDSASFSVIKDPCFITPADIRNMNGMELVYRGRLDHYQPASFTTASSQQTANDAEEKSSFKLIVTRQIKRFVMR